MKKLLADLNKKENPYFTDIPFVRKNGEIFLADIASKRLKCKGFSVAVGFLRDRGKLARKSFDWAILYEQLAEMTAVAVCIVYNRKLVFVNKCFVEILAGKSTAEFIDRDAVSIFPEGDRGRFNLMYENLMSGIIPVADFKQKLLRFDGTETDCLIRAVRATFNGESAAHIFIKQLNCKASSDLWNEISQRASLQKPETKLTKKEEEIMNLTVMGNNPKEIAHKLGIAYYTVMAHRRNLMNKLGVKNVAELTLYAIKNGFVLPGKSAH